MMKGKKIYLKLSILTIITLLIVGTQVLAASLGKVTGVKAVPGKTSVTVSWSRLSGATQYQVDVYIPGIGWVPQSKTTALTKTITGFEEGETYKVRVTGYNGSTKGTTSSEVTFKTGANTSSGTVARPAQVTGVKVLVNNTSATVSWNRATNATQYQVDVYIPGIGWVSQSKTTALSKTITGFEPNTTYKVRVKAYNGSVAGPVSSEVTFKTTASSSGSTTTKPAQVTGVRVTTSGTTATFSWNSAANATQYRIDIYIPGVGWVTQTKIAGLAIKMRGFTAGETYKVRIIGYNGSIAGTASTAVSFTIAGASSGTATPAQVTGVRVRPSNTTATISWNSAANATQYQVEIYIPGIGYVAQSKTTALSKTITGFEPNTTYKVRVKAYNGSVAGPVSSEVTFKTTASSSGSTTTKPAQVTGVRVTTSGTTATFSWNSAANATQYRIDIYIPGVGWVTQTKIAGLAIKMRGFTAGETYKVRIIGYNGSIAGTASTAVSFTISSSEGGSTGGTTSLGQVTNVKAAPTENAVRVTWNRVSGATQYKVSIYIPGIGYASQGKVSTLYKDITGLNPNTTYKVKVTAYNGSTAGPESSEVTFKTSASKPVAPGAVTNITITNIGQEIAKINFNKATNATSYEVYLKTASTSYRAIGTTTNNYMNLTGLQAGTTYYVVIVAYNGVTPGAMSAEKNFTTTSKNSTLLWPIPGYTTISSKYGMRYHPTTGQYKKHNGIDIPVPTGTEVLAAADGKIILSDNNHASYGKYIMIDHGNGYRTLYAHGSKLVRTSGTVTQGEVIMLSGNTGNSTGPHLHFELYEFNTTRNVYQTVDPELYVNKKSFGSVASQVMDI